MVDAKCVSCTSTTFTCQLSLGLYTFNGPNGLVQNTRAYALGSAATDMAGPTLRVKPGDTFSIALTNNLPAKSVSTSFAC